MTLFLSFEKQKISEKLEADSLAVAFVSSLVSGRLKKIFFVLV